MIIFIYINKNMDRYKISTFSGKIDNIYIKFIKYAKSDNDLEHVKKKYILNNPFVPLSDKKMYIGYLNKLKKKKYYAEMFMKKIKKKREKRNKILSKFVNIVKYNILVEKPPCNQNDLYTLEEYNKDNKNIYVIDIKNTKWWFSIETICKLICSNLSYFDTETYNVMCKEPINPFINKPFNKGQLINIYEQLEKCKKIPKIFMLYRIANFDINYYLKIFNNEIINYSYKFNLYKLDNEELLLILYNLFENNNIYYTNVNKLNLENETVKIDVVELIKKCMLTYRYVNEKRSIRKFISKYNFIMKRARRNTNTIFVLDDETEINFSDEETMENLSDEDYVNEDGYNEEDEENEAENEEEEDEEDEDYINDMEPDNFTVSDSGTPNSQECILEEFIYESTEGVNNLDYLSCMQAYIRGYLERKKINKLKCEMIMKIKNGLVGYLERKKVKEMKNEDDKLINYLEEMKIG